MSIRVVDEQPNVRVTKQEGVRIVWKGTRIAKLIFSSGKIVEFS